MESLLLFARPASNSRPSPLGSTAASSATPTGSSSASSCHWALPREVTGLAAFEAAVSPTAAAPASKAAAKAASVRALPGNVAYLAALEAAFTPVAASLATAYAAAGLALFVAALLELLVPT